MKLLRAISVSLAVFTSTATAQSIEPDTTPNVISGLSTEIRPIAVGGTPNLFRLYRIENYGPSEITITTGTSPLLIGAGSSVDVIVNSAAIGVEFSGGDSALGYMLMGTFSVGSN